MKDKPIIFNGHSVRAILAGIKTQTRRIIKPQPDAEGICYDMERQGYYDTSGRLYKCPYEIGQKLWVRETWYSPPRPLADCLGYAALGEHPIRQPYRVRSPIHLTRHDSRITLEITDIRAQQIQDITEDDAKAEGAVVSDAVELADGAPCYTADFRRIWERIYGIDNPKSWKSNPWVWAVIFERVA